MRLSPPPTPLLWWLRGSYDLMYMEVGLSHKAQPRQELSFCSAVELKENGGAQPLALPTSTLLRTTPATADNRERVSTGTKFALTLWLQHLGR